MPRSFGGGRSNSRGSSGQHSSTFGSSTGPSHQARAQPSSTHQQTTIERPIGGMFPNGMGRAVATGMAFGGGSEIGHSISKSMMGGNEVQHSQTHYPSQQNQTESVNQLSESVNQQLKVNNLFNFRILVLILITNSLIV